MNGHCHRGVDVQVDRRRPKPRPKNDGVRPVLNGHCHRGVDVTVDRRPRPRPADWTTPRRCDRPTRTTGYRLSKTREYGGYGGRGRRYGYGYFGQYRGRHNGRRQKYRS